MTINTYKSSLAVTIQGFMPYLCLVIGMMLFYSLNVSMMDIVTIAILPSIFACGVMHSYTVLENISSYELFRSVGVRPWFRLYVIGMFLWLVIDMVCHFSIGHSIVIPKDQYDPKIAIIIDLGLYCGVMSIIGWTFIPRVVINNESLVDALKSAHRDMVKMPWSIHATIPALCLLSIALSPVVILFALFFIFPFITVLAFPKYIMR